MGILFLGAVVFGIILGQFFKWFILIPASWLVLVLVPANRTEMDIGLLGSFVQFIVLTIGLQIGYVVGLIARDFHPVAMPKSRPRHPWRAFL
jgi:hypothetical protein